MAILSEVPGFVVNVKANEQTLPEFDDEDDEEHKECTASKYVEAATGCPFSIVVRFDLKTYPFKDDDLEMCLYLDGKRVCNFPQESRIIKQHAYIYLDHMTKRGSLYRFEMSELDTTEGATDQSLRGKLDKLGTITVTFGRCRLGERTQRMPRPTQSTASNTRLTADDGPFVKDGKVPEKNLKGRPISHQAKHARSPLCISGLSSNKYCRLSAPQPRGGERARWKYPPRRITPIGQQPFASFTFKYRSRTSLQALGLVPRPPEPLPLEERDVDTLTNKELRELARRQKDQIEHAKRVKNEVKREHDDVDSDDEPEIIRQALVKRVRHSTKDDPIELSDDD